MHLFSPAVSGFSGWLFGNRSDTVLDLGELDQEIGFSGWLFGNRSDTEQPALTRMQDTVSVDGSLATEVIRRNGALLARLGRFQWMALWQQK